MFLRSVIWSLSESSSIVSAQIVLSARIPDSMSFSEIMEIIYKSEPYKRYNYIKDSDCIKCEFFNVCHGGCLHDGFLKSGDFKNKTLLCPAYKLIFAHIKKRLKESGQMQ